MNDFNNISYDELGFVYDAKWNEEMRLKKEAFVNNKLKEYIDFLFTCQDESSMQTYLEQHSDFLPYQKFLLNHGVHLSSVIAKLQIGHSYKTDFAYITKSSNEWYLVLVEIEKPTKRFFNRNDSFSKDFNQAYEQIKNWESYLSDANHKSYLIQRFEGLREPRTILRDDNVNIKYLLVYGRSNEWQRSKQRRIKLNSKNTNDIRVCTYDTICEAINSSTSITDYSRKIIFSPVEDNRFMIKYLPDHDDIPVFAWCSKDTIVYNEDIKRQLMAMGFEMEQYEKGENLSINHKRSSKNFNGDDVISFFNRTTE
jgi:hypothetical protein